MIDKFLSWFFSPSKKPMSTVDSSISCRLAELEERYLGLLMDVKRLEEENIETTNTLYELSNCIDAVDTRIDILTLENWNKKNV